MGGNHRAAHAGAHVRQPTDGRVCVGPSAGRVHQADRGQPVVGAVWSQHLALLLLQRLHPAHSVAPAPKLRHHPPGQAANSEAAHRCLHPPPRQRRRRQSVSWKQPGTKQRGQPRGKHLLLPRPGALWQTGQQRGSRQVRSQVGHLKVGSPIDSLQAENQLNILEVPARKSSQSLQLCLQFVNICFSFFILKGFLPLCHVWFPACCDCQPHPDFSPCFVITLLPLCLYLASSPVSCHCDYSCVYTCLYSVCISVCIHRWLIPRVAILLVLLCFGLFQFLLSACFGFLYTS